MESNIFQTPCQTPKRHRPDDYSAEDPSVKEMFYQLLESNGEIKKTLEEIKCENDLRYRELKDEILDVKSSLEAKTEEQEKKLSLFEKKLNWKEQKELLNRMEISRIKLPPKNENPDVMKCVLQLLNSMDIEVGTCDINFASSTFFLLRKAPKR